MQTIFPDSSIKEYLFFDLARCIDELYVLHNDFTMLDIEALKQACKKLRDFIENKRV
ncbi:MAG: hypothetical protein H0U75_12085 [Legionella sp.]|nr:hypothetical protein [Legionella sp.]